MVLLNTLENHSTLQPKLFRNLLLPAAVLHVGQPLGFKQWGLAGQTDEIVTFPVAFASAVFTVVKSLKDVTYSSTFSPMYISNTNYTLTGFTQNRANTVIGGSRPWVAFGKQKQWGYLAGNNAKWTYPLSISKLLYVGVSGVCEAPDESVNYTKESFVTYTDLTHLWFCTDVGTGDNYFIVICI